MSKGKMTVRRLSLIAVLITILFVQEQLLTFIPNVQLTFLLLIVYSTTLPLGYNILIVIIHVLLDNLFMNSFQIQVLLPMLIGYLPTILLGYLFKNKNEYMLAVIGVIGSITYALSFALLNVLFFNTELIPYIIADIPFTIVLCMSSALSILFLYKPIKKVIIDNLERFNLN